MTEIFLLGTFHFLEKNWDICSKSVQREISEFVCKLAVFQPDAVAVEGAVHQQKAIDEAYSRVRPESFDDADFMRKTSLGQITLFGETRSIPWNNECVQIGFRLAKLLNLPGVYAIDADMLLDDALLGDAPQPEIARRLDALNRYTHQNKGTTLTDAYRCYNSKEWSRLNHLIYLSSNAINPDGHYPGAAFVSQWYERNLRIFAEIQALAGKHRRIFVLYGAGHLHILRELINASDNMKLVSLEDIL